MGVFHCVSEDKQLRGKVGKSLVAQNYSIFLLPNELHEENNGHKQNRLMAWLAMQGGNIEAIKCGEYKDQE